MSPLEGDQPLTLSPAKSGDYVSCRGTNNVPATTDLPRNVQRGLQPRRDAVKGQTQGPRPDGQARILQRDSPAVAATACTTDLLPPVLPAS